MTPEEKKLVLARMESMPEDLIFVVGARKYKKRDLMVAVLRETDIGELFVKIQMTYLRGLKDLWNRN
ncbi:MAG TPA: hypothetical protein ENH95_02890 [Nitrosopumilus sp.]|nr:hypothetical protein [Nitrosopumilus sp.]